MHRLGVHLAAIANTADGQIPLHDAAYDFNSQIIYPLDPLRLAKDDSVDVRCTYDNDTDATVHWGNSTLAEMCFALLFRYPRADHPQFNCP